MKTEKKTQATTFRDDAPTPKQPEQVGAADRGNREDPASGPRDIALGDQGGDR